MREEHYTYTIDDLVFVIKNLKDRLRRERNEILERLEALENKE